MRYYIGVDGGGTKTEITLFNESKKMLDTVKVPGSNHENLKGSFQEAADIIMSGIQLLLESNQLTQAELQALCDFCEGTLAHVNLIQLNEVEGSRFKPSTQARADEFVRRLAGVGVEATLRNSRGADIDAACGQLKQRLRNS